MRGFGRRGHGIPQWKIDSDGVCVSRDDMSSTAEGTNVIRYTYDQTILLLVRARERLDVHAINGRGNTPRSAQPDRAHGLDGDVYTYRRGG